MRFGSFDDDRREYVIDRPDAPHPWINYLGTGDFIGIISNTAGGYAFYRDARLRRLTRYRYNNVPVDEDGRFLYLRDDADGSYWSPTWRPTRRALEEYSCRHGLGYTSIASSRAGIHACATYLVPLQTTVETWSLELTNRRDAAAQLSLFSAVEFCLWNAHDDATNFQRNLNVGEVSVWDRTIVHRSEFRERRNHVASFSCSEPLAGFETRRDAFLGPYRGWSAPRSVEQGTLTHSIGVGGFPIAAHHVRLTLHPGETKRVLFVLGYHELEKDPKRQQSGPSIPNPRAIEAQIAPLLTADGFDRALRDLRSYWDEKLQTLQVETGDVDVDRMVNIWNPYQCGVTYTVSRSASRYESGIGRGIGFRDANQDLLGCVHMIPALARQRILDLASTQLASGGAYHQYQPLTKQGNNAIGSGFNDDPLWLIHAVCAYIKESGDWEILEEQVAYGDDGTQLETIYQHLIRAANYTLDRLGPHRLPLIGRADWNDCLNLNSHSLDPDEPFQTVPVADGTVAESVLIAALFCIVAPELAEIASRRGDGRTAQQLSRANGAMRDVVRENGWDGDWFLRAYDADGAAVGSSSCDEGRIYLEPQGLCTMAGMGIDDGRARRALDSVAEQLATEHGLLLVQPAYSGYRTNLGEISSYPPGYKENGSIFCHTNPWIVIAECMIGRGDRAWDYAQRINPSHREAITEIHECEPYVYAQMIAGRDADDHGKARNSWLTGTASWAYVAMTQWVLGIRPTFDGLVIDPCIPAGLQRFSVRRTYRGTRYEIRVSNPDGVCRGVASMHADGVPVEGACLPVFDDRRIHVVDVRMGTAT